MVEPAPVRVHEIFSLVAVAREEIGPYVHIDGAAMEVEEVVSSIESVESEVVCVDTCCPELTPDELMILFGALALNIKFDDALVYVVGRVVQLCDVIVDIMLGHLRIVPALILVPVDGHSSPLLSLFIGRSFHLFGTKTSLSLVVSVHIGDALVREIGVEGVVRALDHRSRFDHVGCGVFEAFWPGKTVG